MAGREMVIVHSMLRLLLAKAFKEEENQVDYAAGALLIQDPSSN